MKWAKERDLLIAQTMAFVQSIGGKRPEPEAPAARPEIMPVELTPAVEASKVQPPVGMAPLGAPRPILRSDVREEIEGRVAAFRAHQQLFDRERDAYFNSVFARVRKPGDQPPNTTGG
jgi:hypothetical protein